MFLGHFSLLLFLLCCCALGGAQTAQFAIPHCTTITTSYSNKVLVVSGDLSATKEDFAEREECLRIDGVNNLVIEGNGHTINSPYSVGINIINSANITVRNLFITNCDIAVNIDSSPQCTISGIEGYNLRFASDLITVRNSIDATLVNNTLRDSQNPQHAISAVSSDRAYICNNTAIRLTVSSSHSGKYFVVHKSAHTVVRNNLIEGIKVDRGVSLRAVPASANLTFSYIDFQAIRFNWAPPVGAPGGSTFDYSIYRVTNLDGAEPPTVIYNGGAVMYDFNSEIGFNKYYWLTTTIDGTATVNSTVIYVSRTIQFGASMNPGYMPVVKFNSFNQNFYVGYSEANAFSVLEVTPSGSSTKRYNVNVPFPIIDLIFCTGGTVAIGEGKGMYVFPANQWFNLTDVNFLHGATNAGNARFLVTYALDVGNAIHPAVAMYDFSLSVPTFLNMAFDSTIAMINLAGPTMAVKYHSQRQFAYWIVYSNNLANSYLMMTNVTTVGAWETTKYQLASGEQPYDLYVDEDKDVVYIISTYTYVANYHIITYNIKTGTILSGPDNYLETVAIVKTARSKGVGGGVWHHGTYTDFNFNHIRLDYNDLIATAVAQAYIPMGDPVNTVHVNSLATDNILNVAVAGEVYSYDAVKVGYLFESPGYYFVTIVPESFTYTTFTFDYISTTEANLVWTPPIGVKASNIAALSYVVEYNNGNGWAPLSTALTVTHFTSSNLLPSTMNFYRLKAQVNAETIYYPELQVNTLYDRYIDSPQLALGYETERVLTALDATTNILHVVTILRIAAKRAGRPGTYIAYDAITGANLQTTPLTIDDGYVIHAIALDTAGKLVMAGEGPYVQAGDKVGAGLCNYDLNSNGITTCVSFLPDSTSTRRHQFEGILVLPSSEIWLVGSTNGATPGHTRQGEEDTFVTILPNGNVATPAYLQWGGSFKENAASIQYNPNTNLIYVLSGTVGFDGYKVKPKVTVIVPASRYVIDSYEWLFETQSSGNSDMNYLIKLVFDPYYNRLAVLASYMEVVARYAQGAGTVTTIQLAADGQLIHQHNVTYVNSTTTMAATPYGLGVAGSTDEALAGNLKVSTADFYYGYVNGSISVQFGYAQYSNVFYSMESHPYNFNNYYIGTSYSGGAGCDLRLRIVQPPVPFAFGVGILSISKTSFTIFYDRPDVPAIISYIPYAIVCYQGSTAVDTFNTSQAGSHTFIAAMNTAYNCTVTTPYTSAIIPGIPVFDLTPVRFGEQTDTTVVVQIDSFPQSLVYQLEYATASDFTTGYISTAAVSSKLTGLTTGVTYYFRIAAYYTVGKFFYSPSSTITLQGSVPAPPSAKKLSTRSVYLEWNLLYPELHSLEYSTPTDSTFTQLYSSPPPQFIVRNLQPSSVYTFRLKITVNNTNFYSQLVNVTTLALPVLTVSEIDKGTLMVSWNNIFYPQITYTLKYGRVTFQPVPNITADSNVTISGLRSNTTYTFFMELTDFESIVTTTPNIEHTTPIDPFVSLNKINAAGKSQIYATAMGPIGNAYSLGYTTGANPDQNSNFIVQTNNVGSILSYRQYGPKNEPQEITSVLVTFTGLVFVGPKGSNSVLCVSGADVNCTTISAVGGQTTAVSVARDSAGLVWVVGYTSGVMPNCVKAGQIDAFAIINATSPNPTYLQWGTTGDDKPTAIAVNGPRVYISGSTTGNFAGYFSTAVGKTFITEISYSTKAIITTTQYDLPNRPVIKSMSFDENSNSLTFAGSLGVSGRKRAVATGFVASVFISDSGSVIPNTFYQVPLGVGNEIIVASAYNPFDGSIIVVGAVATDDQGVDGVFFRVAGGVASPGVLFGTVENDDYPSSVIVNSVNSNIQIFGTHKFGGNPVGIFMFNILPGEFATISPPQFPAFGAITTNSIEVFWPTPVPAYNYTLLLYNNSVYTPLANGHPNRFVFSSLRSDTTYTFAVQMAQPANANFVTQYSTNVVAKTLCVGAACVCTALQVKCKDGSCVNSASQCPIEVKVCGVDKPYLCANQTCVASYKECDTTNVSCANGFVCWDGSCQLSRAACTNVPTCPVLTRRCPDGTCLPSTVECKNSTCNNATLCGDGSCPPCLNVYGCPLATPYLCPNGTCVINATQCRSNCSDSTYLCFDGTCKANYTQCIKPPRLARAIPFSYILPQFTNSNKNNIMNVPILSQDLTYIAQVTLPYSIFPLSNSSNITYTLDVAPVPDTALYTVNGSNIWGNFSSYSSSILSAILSLTIPGIPTSNFSVHVNLYFNNILPPSTNTSNLCIGYINEATSKWECESNLTIENGVLSGWTSHFTKFAVLGKVSAPHVNTIDDDSFRKFGDVDETNIPLYVLSGIVFVYLVGIFFTIRSDRRRTRYLTMHTSSSSIALSEVGMTSTPSTPSLSSTPSTPSSPAMSTPMVPPDFEKETEKNEKKRRTLKEMIMFNFRKRHSWFTVFLLPKNGQLTRTAMLTLLMCMILGNFLISAVFYQYNDDIGIAQKVITGIIVGSIVFPITLIITLIFRKTPVKYWYIPYAIAYGYCAICIVFTLVYTLEFGKEKTKAWLISMAISTGQDGAINQPIKIVLAAIFMLIFPASFITTLLK